MKPDSSSTPPSGRPLRIVIVNSVPHLEEDHDEAAHAQAEQRAEALRTGLMDAGYNIVAALPADLSLPDRIASLQPDMIIIEAESDARDVLEHIVIATRDERRPIVMFTEDDDTGSMDAAMAAGVTAYIVAGLHSERIKPVLDVALARFRQEQKLLAELSDTRNKLAERKLVERAKGVLMARKGLSEEQAYQKLRSMAMNRNLKLSEVAQRLLDAEDLLG
ncbi:ANTAR domain-containing protein [Herbaspirillum sp. WKF16]|jgi:response regulator NasT|uniref:ANTAR domain-containing response regulator n=1 Tax=Herbaspirillum sp. WKF16 TaxID=3028312 RepID=UPI0023A95843|nr:ANTAR domain-containing protein [Herbaspirillum sp. WKF16]WDZ97157.1 ANTAR domain-containing protein [Herbaspirillum sp. WKF16]